MMRISVAILALVLVASPAYSAPDPRLKRVHYEPDKVVSVQGRLGYQSMIEFGESEQIENVAVGNSAAWQVTPNRRANLLFLKPLSGKTRTNLTVVTDRRVYLFDLSVAAAGDAPVYNLSFTYDAPKPSGPRPQTRLAAAPPAPPAKLNFAWKAKGEKDLLPVQTCDDGHSLYLQWRPGTPLPALLTRGPDGIEGPLNYSQVGAFLVVDQVPKTLVIRLDKRVATLTNRQKPAPMRIAER